MRKLLALLLNTLLVFVIAICGVACGGSDWNRIKTADNTAPIATLSGQPTGTVNYITADIVVAGASVVSYKYKLDGGSWSTEKPVSTHIILSNLANGLHTISVVGKDTADKWQTEALSTTTSWTVDTTLLVATISGQPTGTVSYITADIIVAGASVVSYKYKLDSGTWSTETPVSTHIILSNLANGLHTISVVGKNAAGNWQTEALSTTTSWTVDTTLLVATISGQPIGTVNYSTADIIVSGSNVVSYKYKLDSGTWSTETPVSTHIILSNLANGLHTISVVGKNAAGNWQTEALSTTTSWTVDTTLLVATISGQPIGTVNYSTADIIVSGSNVVSYKYKLDSGTWSTETPVSTHIILSNLANGLHTISVVGKNAAGNWQTEALSTTTSWTVNSITLPTKVVFPDAKLEAYIRQAIGKSQGDIYQADLVGLTSFGIGSMQQRGVTDITGLDHCTSLTWLNLRYNQISNISPLSSLTSLTYLDLLGNQNISNISPLSSLTSLTTLYINQNQISDLSPLSSLTNLAVLDLTQNQISDIGPLVNNPGLGQGDSVYLTNNPLGTTSVNTYIPALEARGVTIYR